MSNILRPMFMLLVLLFASSADAQRQKEITIDQLAEGILALNRDLKENHARLERHELRERQLGEHLKRSLAAIEKQIKHQQISIDGLRDTLNRIIGNLDQREERERVQMQNVQKTTDRLSGQLQDFIAQTDQGGYAKELRDINERLEQITLSEGGGNANDLIAASRLMSDAATKLVSGETKLEEHTNRARALLDHLKNEVDRLKDVQKSGKTEYDSDDDSTLSSIQENVETIQRVVTEIEKHVTSSATRSSDDDKASNRTLEALAAAKEELLTETRGSRDQIMDRINVMRIETNSKMSTLNAELSDVKVDTTKSVQSLRELEGVSVQTAEGLEDAKRRIELSGQQTLYQIRTSLKENADYVNETVSERFEQMAAHILANQTISLQNMSSALESEISQVWRQIGIMYSQLTQSVSTLDRLQNQTETYVNGSLTTMDNMSGKVGQLSGTMAEVDGNLNYLLGRISLVTREFNMIKNELGPALDQARTDFAKLHNAAVSQLPAKQQISEPIEDNLVGTK